MATYFDWGLVKYGSVAAGRYPVDEGGRRLFLIRNGDVVFPENDYRKWLPGSSEVSAIGRLNTNAIEFQIELKSPCSSKDEHRFRLQITAIVRIKDFSKSRIRAAKEQDALETSIKSVLSNAARDVFREAIYQDIYFEDLSVREAFKSTLKERVWQLTPYQLEGVEWQVNAVDPSVDSSIEAARRTVALEAERARTEAIERERIRRTQAAEIDLAKHQDSLAAERAARRRALVSDDAEAEINLEQKREVARVEAMKAMAGAVKDIDLDLLIALSDPKAAAEIRKATLLKNHEIGRAHGLIEGVKGALRLQDLNPVPDTTVHIIRDEAAKRDSIDSAAKDASRPAPIDEN